MDLESIIGQTEGSMRVTGLMVNNTILELFETKMKLNADCGRRVNVSSGLTNKKLNRFKGAILTTHSFTRKRIVFQFRMGHR